LISLAIVQHVEVAGLRIAYRRAGSGPSLLLLHGGLSDSREWRPQLDAFSKDFNVVAWDAPGCGGSSDPPETIGLDGYADCLAAFIDALGLERPHVAGLSFGAGLALELYRRHPRLPRSLLLASAYAGWAGSLPADAEELHAAIPGSRLVWMHGVGHQSNLEAPARFNDEARAFLSSVS